MKLSTSYAISYAIGPDFQSQQRSRLYAAHQKTLDEYWDLEGNFIWPTNLKAHGGYRSILWHCLSYLTGDEYCVERANRIILTNYVETPCHFTPGAAVDVLFYYRERLWPEAIRKLERYLQLHIPYMSTEDLKIHGYNDNHPYKAMHAMVVGGEMLGMPHFVERGVFRLRQALEMCRRNRFPCEYNSPNYTPVSLQPLASLVEQTKHSEARELALELEHYYWNDLALHFDARAGIPTGPMSRAGIHDYDGLLSHDLLLLLHLFPEHFEIELVEEVFEKKSSSRYIAPEIASSMPFYQSHPIWSARAEYHLTHRLVERIFDRKDRVTVRGSCETGTGSITWSPEQRPLDAPKTHHFGPRRSLLTTYYGENFTLGTAQYSWLNNAQAHGFYATIASPPEDGEKLDPARSASYFTRHFSDDHYPFGPDEQSTSCFKDEGEIRTLQHEGTALVFYNPLPIQRQIQRIRTGIFRPLRFSRPRQIFVGESNVPHFNYLSNNLETVAIDEGSIYVGIVPLRLTDRGQSLQAALQIHTYSDHLAICMSSFEAWSPQDFSYDEIIETNAGFIFEIHAANQFTSFAHFRHWLSEIEVEDGYYALMRTTTYRNSQVTLSTCYSPFQSAFRHATIDGQPIESLV